MIYPLGKDLQPWVDFLSLPINDNDIIIVVRNSDLSKPFAVRWGDLRSALVVTGAISVSDEGTVVVNQAANINFTGQGVTVTASGNTATVNIPGGGGCTPILLQTNSVTNPVQNILNLVEGTNMVITDDGLGNITFDASGGGGGTYTVNNGLTENPANNFQLGGTLVQNTQINNGSFYLEIIGNVASPLVDLFRVINSGTGRAIYATNSGGSFPVIEAVATTGIGVQGVSTNSGGVIGASGSGTGVSGNSTSWVGVQGNGLIGVVGFGNGGVGGDFSSSYSSTNIVEPVLNITRFSSSTPANGIGASIDFSLPNSLSVGTISNYIISKLTTATALSEVSQLEFWGKNAAPLARLLALTGAGQLILDKYGINTFTGTPAYALGVDATGNVVEFTPATGGGTVTSVATAGLISGGPITTSGTITTSMNTNKLVGRGSAGTGIMEEITLGTNLSLSGTTLNATSGGILHGTASGTDTYTVTITGVTAYNDGDPYLIRFTNGNTSTSTLNINGLGAIPLYRNNDGQVIGGDIWDGAEMLCVYNSTANEFQVIGTSPNSLFAYVTNAESISITKGQPVYAFGGTGDRMTVKLAFNTSDATSAQTVGLVYSTSIAANQKGFIIIQGLLDNLSILPTSTWSDGDPVYLGATAGAITKVKPYAPNHLVYLGIVTTASNGNAGRMYVRVQNGYELDELHNVQARTPALKDTLWYDNTVSPAQWKTASIATILGYTPLSQTLANTNIFVGNASNIATAVAMSGDATIANTGALTIASNLKTSQITTILDGQGGVIQTGRGNNFLSIPFSGTITGWTILSSVSGSIEVAFWKDTYANYPPTVADNVFSPNPSLTSTNKNTATGLSIAVTAGDIIIPNVVSVTTCTNVTIAIQITRS